MPPPVGRDRNPRRIFVVTPLPDTVVGGIEEYAFGVASGLTNLGREVRVATSQIDNGVLHPPGVAQVQIRTLMLLGRPIPWNPWFIVQLLREMRQADVIHLHMPYPGVEAVVGWLAKITNVPLVVTYQMDALILESSDSPASMGRFRLVESLYRRLSSQWPLRAATVVVTSTHAYSQQSPVLPEFRNKLRIIHQGVTSSRFHQGTEERANELRTMHLEGRFQRMVLFVGRLVPYKGVEYLLHAIPEVDDADVVYVIGGKGPEESYLRQLVEDLKLDNVRFAGFVPDSDLFALFRASDLVVAPSVSELENTPITLLGALSVGTPVIGTTAGGTGETVPDDHLHGIIVPPRDVHAIAAGIIELLGKKGTVPDPLPPRFWENVAEDYDRLFQEVLRGRQVSLGATSPLDDGHLGPHPRADRERT